jgi:hypothetical protein
MAIKTGFSHALATLLLTLVSSLLVYFLRHVGLFERIFDVLISISFRFTQWLERSMSINISYEIFPVVFVAAILAFIWGVIFQISRD